MMSSDPGPVSGGDPKRVQPEGSISTTALLRSHPSQMAAIAVILASVSAVFAYTGGFLTSNRLDPSRIVNAMEAAGGGPYAGFRRAHSKGVCIAGTFVGSKAGRSLSKATVFVGHPVPVTGRFAEAGADPFAKDSTQVVRSMALRLQPLHAAEWRMAINDTPGLNVSTPQAFYESVVASIPVPGTGKPDPRKMQAFLGKHPEAAAFMERMQARRLASGFTDDSYNSVDGFIFEDADGTRRLVRWTMQAEDRFASSTEMPQTAASANAVFDGLLARVAKGPVRWRMIATLAQPGDVNRAAEVWPADRPHVDLGELTIDRVESEATGNCRDINFDPLVLPPGVLPSDDPIPFARSAVYAISFRRRAGEFKSASAINHETAGARP